MSTLSSTSKPCNVVLVAHLPRMKPANLPNTTLISTHTEPRLGTYHVVQPSLQGLTLTNLPNPIGRTRNFELQKQVIEAADFFIFLVTTVGFSVMNLRKCPQNVPSICWIDNSNEEEAISEWIQEEKLRLTSLAASTTQLATQKDNDPNKPSVPTYSLDRTGRKHPVTSLEKVKTIVQEICGDNIEFFSCSSTSLKRLLNQETEITDEFNLKWETMLKRTLEIFAQNPSSRKQQDIETSKQEQHDILLRNTHLVSTGASDL